MKKIEITLNGQREEKIAQAIMESIYGAIKKNGYCDINVTSHTEQPELPVQVVAAAPKSGDLEIPGFMADNMRARASRYETRFGVARKRG